MILGDEGPVTVSEFSSERGFLIGEKTGSRPARRRERRTDIVAICI